MEQVVFAVITVSDSCHQDATKDRSGPRLRQLIAQAFDNATILSEILPDECNLIQEKLQQLVDPQHGPPVSVIITTGGTGFAPRDVTPEATKVVLHKECTQLAMAIALSSLQKTPFAALSRGLCGIAYKTLILNFPGSEKAVVECFEVVRDLLPHALHLIQNDLALVKRKHQEIQSGGMGDRHVCPHKTGKPGNPDNDRNSPYEMIAIEKALAIIFDKVTRNEELPMLLNNFASPVDIPPFRASIKDGYAMVNGFSGTKKVLGSIAAGDPVNMHQLQEDECFKINTGAPIPHFANCVVQVEDTKLLKRKKDGQEDLVEILVEPSANLDIRPVGCDLQKGSKLFPAADHSAVVIKSLMASVGHVHTVAKPKVVVVSTGSELLDPSERHEAEGHIFDSNSTMLVELLQYFGFECARKLVLGDDFNTVEQHFREILETADFVICSGGVSMGDKDYIKPVLQKLGFDIHFGRVNMKPGKPMTFASRENAYFFGLPGNPVSAFVTFHLFALPALRWSSGWDRAKCELATISVILDNESVPLDPRPEYMRASVTNRKGQLHASINGNQMSSRLQSIVGADVLVHLPAYTKEKPCAKRGDVLKASVLRYDFISKYE